MISRFRQSPVSDALVRLVMQELGEKVSVVLPYDSMKLGVNDKLLEKIDVP